jgi:hypothetical protein
MKGPRANERTTRGFDRLAALAHVQARGNSSAAPAGLLLGFVAYSAAA